MINTLESIRKYFHKSLKLYGLEEAWKRHCRGASNE